MTEIYAKTAGDDRDKRAGDAHMPSHQYHSTSDLQILREALPEYLERIHGVTNPLKRFHCIHPAHDDQNPSMSYDRQTCRVKCFSCGESGDIFDVCKWDSHTESFPEQVRIAANAVGIAWGAPLATARPSAFRGKTDRARVACADIGDGALAAFVNLYEHAGTSALNYLYGRGFSDAEISANAWGFLRSPHLELPELFSSACADEEGFLLLPFPDSPSWEASHYAVVRPLQKDACSKERKPSGMQAPLWKEYLLRGETVKDGPVYVTEGIFDAVSLGMLLKGAEACALCGQNSRRLLEVVTATPTGDRPNLILALDADDAGSAMTNAIAEGLDKAGVRYSILPPYPFGAKDANEVLMRERDLHVR